MNTTVVERPSFKCAFCKYKHQGTYDPYEPGRMALEFPEFPGMPDGHCPACWSGKNKQRMVVVGNMLDKTTASADAIVSTVAGDDTLGEHLIEEVDADGNTIMVDTGEFTYEPYIDQRTGIISTIQMPIMRPKMRERTKSELDAAILKRDISLDDISKEDYREIHPEEPIPDEPIDDHLTTK